LEITGANHEELADWFATVKAQFDGLAPQLTDVIVPVKTGAVVALLFETDRSPFVVRNPVFGQQGGGPVQFEVPWRENTSTRTATRSELIKLLSPLQKLPDFAILSATLNAEESEFKQIDNSKQLRWSLETEIYVVPRAESRVVIPYHKLSTSFEIGEGPIKTTPMGTSIVLSRETRMLGIDTGFIRTTESELIIDGPGKIRLNASAVTPVFEILSSPVRVNLVLEPAGAEVAAYLSASLTNIPATGFAVAKWKLG